MLINVSILRLNMKYLTKEDIFASSMELFRKYIEEYEELID